MKEILVGMTVLFTAGASWAGDWAQWRGPELNGTCDAGDLPAGWSLEDGSNVAWVCDLPGSGRSTPIVVGERVFLTAGTDDHTLHALAVDRASGETVWVREAGTGRAARRGNTMASPSAVSDGQRVYFLFGQGTLIAVSMDGEPCWTRALEEDHGTLSQKFGFSSSPLLYKGTLYIPLLYLAADESKPSRSGAGLLAIDAATGATRWTANRPTPAARESRDSYMTPILGPEGIVLAGSDLVTSHDPDTGREQWRFDYAAGDRNTNWRLIAGPVVAGDLVVFSYPRGRALVALGPGGEKVWEHRGYAPDVCTPAYENGLLYVLDGKKRYLTCLDASNGKEVWRAKLDSQTGFFASPLVADGRVYAMNLSGEVFIFAAGPDARQIGRLAATGENCAASPVAADDSLFVRTSDKLICVRKR